jgi:hypothetical protein
MLSNLLSRAAMAERMQNDIATEIMTLNFDHIVAEYATSHLENSLILEHCDLTALLMHACMSSQHDHTAASPIRQFYQHTLRGDPSAAFTTRRIINCPIKHIIAL